MTRDPRHTRTEAAGSDDALETMGDHLRQRAFGSEERMALDRVRRELQVQGRGLARLAEADGRAVLVAPKPKAKADSPRRTAWAVAAGVLLTLTVSGALARWWMLTSGASDAPAVVEAIDGGLYRVSGERSQAMAPGDRVRPSDVVRTNGGAGAQLVLSDGSRVEMRSQSELSLARADDGLQIHLRRGGIIVNAAKQRTGHLIVNTKDVTVSVVGTVFMVNTEDNGSRVVVIEGEVRVQQDATEKTLLPGEQMTTGPQTPPATLEESLTWSRRAVEHVAQLQQFAVAAPVLPFQDAPREAFEAVSIRPTTVSAVGAGRGAGGGGGVSRRNRRGDDPCSSAGEPVVDPRRFDAVNVTVVQLVSWAYGLDCWMNRGPDVLFGGPPDWIKKDGFDVVATIPVAAPSYTTPQLRAHEAPVLQRMLQSMLTDRFMLTTRRETREMPVYVLSVAAGGPKYTQVNAPGRFTDLNGKPLDKPVVVNGIPMPGRLEPPADHVSPEFSIWADGDTRNLLQLTPWEIHGRRKTVPELARTLSLYTGRPVLDRSNLTGQFNYFFEFAVMECATCPFTAPGPGSRRPESGTPWPDRSLFNVLEQVGLELKPSREQVEVLVIERVERPTEN
jgi:uncharacterized protein (TIGR03435 family)